MSESSTSDWTAIDAAADRFEQVWKDGQRHRIEDYLAEADESRRAALLEELLGVELELRRRAGEEPMADEYRSRFPEHAGTVDLVFVPVKPALSRNGHCASPGQSGASFDHSELREVLRGVAHTSGSVPRVLLRGTEPVDEKCFTGSFSDEIPRDTGRYQIFGEIGRGGMGVGLPVVG